MGNSPSGPRLLGNGNYSSYDIKLGKAATISVTKDEGFYERFPSWKLTYDVDGVACTLSLVKTIERNSGDDILYIDVKDCHIVTAKLGLGAVSVHQRALISFTVQKEKETGLLYPTTLLGSDLKPGNCLNFHESLSGEVETQSWTYADGSRKGLIVAQQKKKKKSKEEGPYMVTLAHYFVNTASYGNFGAGGMNLGFSVVVKIGVISHTGRLDFSVEGPEEHPSSALLYMIEEVVRTGAWKPSACPHCKNLQWQQRRWVSESEDSDTNLPTPPFHGGQQNASNKGRFSGDGIGSMIHANKVNFNKWWT